MKIKKKFGYRHGKTKKFTQAEFQAAMAKAIADRPELAEAAEKFKDMGKIKVRTEN